VLIVRGTVVNKAAIDAGKALNLIIRAGAGVSNIDVSTASERGIYVANCPGKNASAVAELTLTLIGCLDRRVPDGVASLRSGKWEKHEFARAVGLNGRKIGILGTGHVGRAVIKLAQAYGMQPYAWSRSLSTSRAADLGVVRTTSPEELARSVDIFSVHLDLSERTRGIVDRKVIEALQERAMFVNTARAELCDYDALLEAIPKKGLRVGLDVLPNEPDTREGSYSHPILKSGLVYATPHIGASTDEAEENCAIMVADTLRDFLENGNVKNSVNFPEAIMPRTAGAARLVIANENVPNMVGQISSALADAKLNIADLLNKSRGDLAYTLIDVDGQIPDAVQKKICAIPGVLSVRIV